GACGSPSARRRTGRRPTRRPTRKTASPPRSTQRCSKPRRRAQGGCGCDCRSPAATAMAVRCRSRRPTPPSRRSTRWKAKASGSSASTRALSKNVPSRMTPMAAPDTITIHRLDDWHVHFRDGAMLRAVAPLTARQFARAIVMPNLVPPVTDAAAARAYRERILAAVPEGADFTALMTCYLTDATDPAEVARGHQEGVFTAVKLYPAHATTHSAHGVTDMDRVMPVLERMAAIGMPLLIHGEVTDPEIDIFDREAVFI